MRALVFDGVEVNGANLPIRAFENTPGLCPRLIRSVAQPFIRWVGAPEPASQVYGTNDSP